MYVCICLYIYINNDNNPSLADTSSHWVIRRASCVALGENENNEHTETQT